MIYCCKEHAEYGLEEIVNQTGEAPNMKPVEKGELPTVTCEYCGQLAAYVVSN